MAIGNVVAAWADTGEVVAMILATIPVLAWIVGTEVNLN